MGHGYLELPAEEAVDFAFTHVEELARLLHGAGHRDMAALLDAFGDLRELSVRRAARGGSDSLIGPGSDTLDYVMAQMSELAELMSRHGAGDAAFLFRTPGQLRAAAESRTYGVGLHPCSNESPAVGQASIGGLKAIRSARDHRGPLHGPIVD
jgi:hypothetical protein